MKMMGEGTKTQRTHLMNIWVGEASIGGMIRHGSSLSAAELEPRVMWLNARYTSQSLRSLVVSYDTCWSFTRRTANIYSQRSPHAKC